MAIHVAVSVTALTWLGIRACILSFEARSRRAGASLPRLIWGPTPLINIKYWSKSVQQHGFTSTTLVYGGYPAFKRDDFDRHLDDFGPRARSLRFLAPYLAFAWCLDNADVFVFSYDGGYLSRTPLRSLECQLIRLAGKRTILIPYGSDIAVPGTIGTVEARVYSAYPYLKERGDAIRKRVMYFCKHADCVVRTYQPGFQPRQDVLWPNALAIDADQWKPTDAAEGPAAQESEVVIVHPTNHRSVKGTDLLISAVDELRNEGLHLRLDIMEGRSNDDVREAMATADIVAEQFIAGYGLTAVEAMALGRVVLSNLAWIAQEFRDGTYLSECPIVNTTPESLKRNLRRLATNPELRMQLGKAGRDYVLKYHSAEAVGRIWKSVASQVWLRHPIAPRVTHDFGSMPEAG